MQNTKQINWNDSLVALLGSGIAAYVILKAICLGITDDEAWSYYNVKRFWYVETLCTGNTHWFNFLAIKVALLLGLEKAWQLRWFTILSSLTFIFIGISWIKNIKATYLKLFALAFLFLNPYLLDYLSLARGYTTALAFMSVSLLLLYKYFKNGTKKTAPFFALIFAGLSAIANFNFFYFFSAFCALYFFTFYFKQSTEWVKNRKFYLELVYSFGIAFLVLRALVFITKCSNDIGGCGGESFVESIFGSYVTKGFVPDDYAQVWWITVCSYVFFGVLMMATWYGIVKFKQHQNRFYIAVCYVFVIMLAFTIINKLAFNVLYPIHRTTLMFYPLYAIILVSYLASLPFEKTILKLVSGLVSGMFLVNFFYHLNLKETVDYYKQADAEKAFEILNDLKAKRIGISPELYVLYIKYYSQIYPNTNGDMVNSVFPIPYWLKEHRNQLQEFDYLLLYPPYNLQYYKFNDIKLEAVSMLPEKQTLIVKVIQ